MVGDEVSDTEPNAVAAAVLFDTYRCSKTAQCIVTRDGRVLHGNLRFRAMAAEGRGAFTLRDGFVVARTPQARDQVRTALVCNLKSLVIVPNGAEEDGVHVALVEPMQQGHYAMVSFWRPDRPPLSLFAPIAVHFQLSPQQARVAAELVSGRTVEQIARKLGVTIDTVRSHLKAIYDKTGARSQAGVIARALRFLRL